MTYYKFIVLLYISYNIEEQLLVLLNSWLGDLCKNKQVQLFIHNTTTKPTYHTKYMICKTTPIIVDYIYSNNSKNTIEYIHSHFDYKYLCILDNPKWVNISLLYSKLQDISKTNINYVGDESNTLYSRQLINDFIQTDTLDINTYMSFTRYINDEILDESWLLNINLTTRSFYNIPFHNNIIITEQDSNIYSTHKIGDIILDHSIYNGLLEFGLHLKYKFNYIIYIYPDTHINLNTLYNVIEYINVNGINYYDINNIFYIASYEYIIKNITNLRKNIQQTYSSSELRTFTLFDFYNNINIYDYHDEDYIYNKYNVNKSTHPQDIIAMKNINMSLSKPFHKYIFVLYTSYNTIDRIDVLREYWLKSDFLNKYKLIIVIGGHKRTHLEREHKFGFDIDILYTEDDDSYIRFPYKVYNSIKYISTYFEFEYLIKVDDDVYLNIKRLYNLLQKTPDYDYMGFELGHKGIDSKWHYGRATPDYEFEWNEVIKGTYYNGPCYVLSNKAANLISNAKHEEYMKHHIYEDVAVSNILHDYNIKRKSIDFFNTPNIYEYFKYTIDNNKNITSIEPYKTTKIKNYVSFHCGPFSGNGKLFYNIDLTMIFDNIDKEINQTGTKRLE